MYVEQTLIILSYADSQRQLQVFRITIVINIILKKT